MVVALAALAGPEVELQSDSFPHGRDGGFDRRFGEDGPPEIGVQHSSGQIEQRPQGRPVRFSNSGEAANGDRFGGRRNASAGSQRGARVLQGGANRLRGKGAAESLDEACRSRRVQDQVDGGQIAQAGRSLAEHPGLNLASLRMRWRQLDIPLSAVERPPRPNAFSPPESLAAHREMDRRASIARWQVLSKGAWNHAA